MGWPGFWGAYEKAAIIAGAHGGPSHSPHLDQKAKKVRERDRGPTILCEGTSPVT